MLITHRVDLDQPGDFEALYAAIEHYKRATPEHTPRERIVEILDSIMARVVKSAEVEIRTVRRPAKPTSD